MMVNVDVAALAFYQPGPLIEVIAKMAGCRSVDDLRRGLQDRDRLRLDKLVRNLTVTTTHRGDKNRVYRIDRFSRVSAAKEEFANAEGRKMTIAAYFQSQYNYRLNFPDFPCVTIKGKRPVSFPPEVLAVILASNT